MKSYHRVMLGRKSAFAAECFAGEGAIIALDDDKRLRWALAAVPHISFYRYVIGFKLVKV